MFDNGRVPQLEMYIASLVATMAKVQNGHIKTHPHSSKSEAGTSTGGWMV